MLFSPATVIVAVAFITQVTAHGYVPLLKIGNQYIPGWNIPTGMYPFFCVRAEWFTLIYIRSLYNATSTSLFTIAGCNVDKLPLLAFACCARNETGFWIYFGRDFEGYHLFHWEPEAPSRELLHRSHTNDRTYQAFCRRAPFLLQLRLVKN